MTKAHIAKLLLERSDVPLKVVKPVATRLGISTNYVGAALFAGQIVYENQEAIVKYADKSGVTVGEFLRARAESRYGPDHPLTEHLRENVDALNEAFEGSEQEALTFAEFYRRLRTVEWNTPDTPDAPDPRGVLTGARDAVTGAKDAVGGAADSVPDPRDAIGDSSGTTGAVAEDADEVVDIPVSEPE
jgi:hypothetical protein